MTGRTSTPVTRRVAAPSPCWVLSRTISQTTMHQHRLGHVRQVKHLCSVHDGRLWIPGPYSPCIRFSRPSPMIRITMFQKFLLAVARNRPYKGPIHFCYISVLSTLQNTLCSFRNNAIYRLKSSLNLDITFLLKATFFAIVLGTKITSGQIICANHVPLQQPSPDKILCTY